VHAYTTAGWDSFFVAEVGAAAALAGLLFVAVSINLTRILSFPQLPGRAAETLIILVGVLVNSTLGLIPDQPPALLGAEIVVVGLAVWAYPISLQVRTARAPGMPKGAMMIRVVSHQLATLPMFLAGLSLVARWGGGLYWLIPGTIFSFSTALINAWVLLVEIQR
jgi:modulator of FtsH protease